MACEPWSYWLAPLILAVALIVQQVHILRLHATVRKQMAMIDASTALMAAANRHLEALGVERIRWAKDE